MSTPGLGAWLPRRRLKHPDKTALIFGDDRRLSYADLATAVERSAAVFADHGIGRGDRVAYLGENSPEFLVTLFGAAHLGAVFVPVNTRLAAPEIAHVLADSGARVLVHDPSFTDRVAAAVSTAPIAHVIGTGASGRDGEPGLARLLEQRGQRAAAGRREPRRSRRARLHLRHHRSRQGRDAHARQPHVGVDEHDHRLRPRLLRRVPHDLAALPRRLARYGGAPRAAERRDRGARERVRGRTRARPHRAPRRHGGLGRPDHLPAHGGPSRVVPHRRVEPAHAHVRRIGGAPRGSARRTRRAGCRSRRATA